MLQLREEANAISNGLQGVDRMYCGDSTALAGIRLVDLPYFGVKTPKTPVGVRLENVSNSSMKIAWRDADDFWNNRLNLSQTFPDRIESSRRRLSMFSQYEFVEAVPYPTEYPLCWPCENRAAVFRAWFKEDPHYPWTPRPFLSYVTQFLSVLPVSFPLVYIIQYQDSVATRSLCCWNQLLRSSSFDDQSFRAEYELDNNMPAQFAILDNVEPFREYAISVSASYIVFSRNPSDVTIGGTVGFSEDTDFHTSPASTSFKVTTLESFPESPPFQIQVTAVSETELILNWDSPAIPNGKITKYSVLIDMMDEQEVEDAFTRVKGLSPGVSYSFRIRARTSVGYGPYSEVVRGRTLDPCSEGSFREVIGFDCIPCSLNTYRTFNDTQCISCPRNLPFTNQTGSKNVSSCFSCPPGTDKTTSECLSCPLNTFSSVTDNTCRKCEDERPLSPFTIGNGKTGPHECLPGPGWYLNREQSVVTCGTDITENPQGVQCDFVGTTIDTITVLDGFWRYSQFATRVFKCPKSEFCVGSSKGRNLMLSETLYCAPFHTGIKCLDCMENYTMKSSGCLRTDDYSNEDSVRFVLMLIVLLLIGVAPASWLLYCVVSSKKQAEKQTEKRTHCFPKCQINCSSSIRNMYVSTTVDYFRGMKSKLRILLGFFQILVIFVREMQPEKTTASNWSALIEVYSAKFLDWFSISAFYYYDYYDMMYFYTLYPIGVVAFTGLVYLFCRFYFPVTAKVSFAIFIRVAIVVAFLVFPSVSSSLIAVFMYNTYETGMPNTTEYLYLIADERIDYASSESQMVRIYSICMLVFYLVGTFAMYWLGARVFRRASEKDALTAELADALNILVAPYKASYASYECIELIRKFILTSGFVILHWYDVPLAIMMFVFACTLFLLGLAKFQPYISIYDQTFAELSIVLMCIVPVVSISRNDSLSITITASIAAVLEFVLVLIVRYFEFQNRNSNEIDDKNETVMSPSSSNSDNDSSEKSSIYVA